MPTLTQHQTDKLLEYAKKYIWWMKQEEAIERPHRIVLQLLDKGEWKDCQDALKLFGRETIKDIVKKAEAGNLSKKSWNFWHLYLKICSYPDMPPYPKRSFL